MNPVPRGAVWDVARDVRSFQTRDFNAAGFDGPVAYVDFSKIENIPRQIAEFHPDSGANAARELKEEFAVQHGLYLLVTKPRNKTRWDRSYADVDVQDLRSGKVLWSRYFPRELPSLVFHSKDTTVLLSWPLSEPGGRDELQRFAELKGHGQKEDYLCEVVDANSGALLASFIVKTNNGSLRHLRGSSEAIGRSWKRQAIRF